MELSKLKTGVVGASSKGEKFNPVIAKQSYVEDAEKHIRHAPKWLGRLGGVWS